MMANLLIPAGALDIPAPLPARIPRAPRRPRPESFMAAFEDRILVYDCFRNADGDGVVMVCPPPLNLGPMFARARFAAGGRRLWAHTVTGPSVTLVTLPRVPSSASSIAMTLGGMSLEIPIAENHSAALEDRRVLFTMNKDNDPDWIADWAAFHQHHHGADAVIVIDNGSTRYPAARVLERLEAVPGFAHRIVLDWPYRYGAHDPAVTLRPYWSHFVQNAAMSVVLRRFAARARGLLNLDIDELAARPADGTTIFETCETSHAGLVVMRGVWIEPEGASDTPRHADFTRRAADPRAARCAQRKWVLDPRRDWVRNRRVLPHVHWIENRPPRSKTMREDLFYWHFKGINTRWKDDRATSAGIPTRPDAALLSLYRSIGWIP
ncbi:hypothetical protein [Pelagibacterium montanilacus]|uniref:hypothetical protein n=1 Tax=Pelagibacterium montanilacus TaxID=2185280 RepID=UPI000F8D5C60|nr:hypothetical protein [Pelagibacterium montanilacus]